MTELELLLLRHVLDDPTAAYWRALLADCQEVEDSLRTGG